MIFSQIDPVKWIDDLFSFARHGRGVTLYWVPGSWYGARVEALLRKYGVRCYGRSYPYKGDLLGVSVRSAQAGWAAYVLGRAGVPVVGPAWAVNAASSDRGLPLAWGVPAPAVGLLGNLAQSLWGGPEYSKAEKAARRQRNATRRDRRRRGGR